ncbi:MAG: hypothetical protein KDA72_10340, partial [Planctomycetales bacterium]|nr:hypothetical protein [Planctomycetales bacterium]
GEALRGLLAEAIHVQFPQVIVTIDDADRICLSVAQGKLRIDTGQFGRFVGPAGVLRDNSSLDIDLQNVDALSRFTGQPVSAAGIAGIQKISSLSVFTSDDVDLLRFDLSELGEVNEESASYSVTLRHISGLGILTIELLDLVQLDSQGNPKVLRTQTTAQASEVQLGLGGLGLTPSTISNPRKYALRISGIPSDDNRDPLRYELLTNVGQAGSLDLSLSLELEETGLNRIMGQNQADVLFGGTGLDFLYGNDAPSSEEDRLYDRYGGRFTSLDGTLAGDEWKEYAESSNKVWYYGGSNLDDVISVDFVTDQDSVLAGHHLITRLTGNNGNFTFDAQVQLSFDARDANGKLIWDPDETFFDHNLTSLTPLRTALKAFKPALDSLPSTVGFLLTVDDAQPVTIIVSSTADDSTAEDVVAEVNTALALAGVSHQVLAELVDGRLQLSLLSGDALRIETITGDGPLPASPRVLGFFENDEATEQIAYTGQLASDATFFLSVYGSEPIPVSVPANPENHSVRELVEDINEALRHAGLQRSANNASSSDIVLAELVVTRALNGNYEQSIRFRLFDGVARTQLEDPTQAAASPLVILGLNTVATQELNFVDGQRSIRERTRQIDVRKLLPPEGDFDAILIDALDGNDQVYVGPTVIKSVWVDGGAGNDLIDIQEGRPILQDYADSQPGGNDSQSTAYELATKDSEGTLQPFDLRQSHLVTGLTIDDELDVDWYQFTLSESSLPRDGDAIVLTSLSADDRLQFQLKQKIGGELQTLVTAARAGAEQRIDLGAIRNSIEANNPIYLQVATSRVPTAYQFEFVTADYLESYATVAVGSTDQTAVDLDAYVGTESGTTDVGLVTGLSLHNATDTDIFKFSYAPRLSGTIDVDIQDINLNGTVIITSATPHSLVTGELVFLAGLPDISLLQERQFHAQVLSDTSFSLYTLDSLGVRSEIVASSGSYLGGGKFRKAPQLDQIALRKLSTSQQIQLELFRLDAQGQEQLLSMATTSSDKSEVAVDIMTLEAETLYLRVSSAEPGAETRAEYELLPHFGSNSGTILVEPLASDLLHSDLGNKTRIVRRDILIGGSGNDRLSGGSGEEWILGGPGNDVLNGGADRQASDLMWGGAGDDIFQIVPSALPLLKSSQRFIDRGNQQTFVPTYNDRFDGGPGNDQVLFLGGDLDDQGQVVRDNVALRYNTLLHRYEIAAQVWNTVAQQYVVDPVTQLPLQHYAFFQVANTGGVPNIESFVIDVRSGDDEVHAEPGYEINGGQWGIDPQDLPQRATLGHLTILGGPGNDRLFGGAGNDLIRGGEGADII